VFWDLLDQTLDQRLERFIDRASVQVRLDNA